MTAEPLVGWAFSSALLALRIGPVFVAMDGHAQLPRLFAITLEAAPL